MSKQKQQHEEPSKEVPHEEEGSHTPEKKKKKDKTFITGDNHSQ